jgi:flagellar biosynthetic protein FlhB
MRMSKDEIKQEFKNRETNPHVKGRQKAFARQIAMGKAVRRTKEATVIITNPTHFAVALKFDFTMRAPLVVAKGKDLIAQRIKEIGREHDIPIVENKALAQTLFKTVELGAEIPMELFKAVSEIILYVFKMKNIKIPRKATRGA